MMTAIQSKTPRLSNSQFDKASGGFSLFELIVFIILVAIIYSVAANRFSQFPAAAERANFLAITTQIQSSINLEMIMHLGRGRQQSLESYQEINPMDLLLRAPSNYLGAFDLVETSRLPRRSWYFDRSTKELVYLINNASNVFLTKDGLQIPTDELRFKTAVSYGYEHLRTGLPLSLLEIEEGELRSNIDYRRQYRGVLVEPTTPFSWSEPAVDLPTIATAES